MASEALQKRFTTFLALHYDDSKLLLIVKMDISSFTIGVVLSLEEEMVYLVAITLTPITTTELNYTIYNKMMLAIVSAFTDLKMVLGRYRISYFGFCKP
jgi:hypothetical protein